MKNCPVYNSYMEQAESLRQYISDAWKDGTDPDIIEASGQKYRELMKKADILKQHTYAISQQYDGRWLSFFKDPESGKLKRIRKQTKREVEDQLIELYRGSSEKDLKITIETLFPEWQEDMLLRGHSSTAVRYHYDWDRYLKGTEFVNMEIKTLKTSQILKGLIAITEHHGLTMRKFRDLKTIINGILDYAVINDLIDINRARQIRNVSPDIFVQEDDKPDEEQIYSIEEQERFFNECVKLYEKHKNPAYLAIVLNFLLGLRAGELCALKLQDFDFEKHVLISQRAEVKNKTVIDGKPSSAGTKIVNHLKCGHRRRTIIIDPEVTESFVRYIVQRVEETGQECREWLFIRPDGRRMTESNIMHAMQIVNRNAQIKQKGNHAIRKTILTKLIQSKLFSTTDIARQAGHNSFETTQKYYAFARREEKDKSERIGQVLAVNFSLGLSS